MLLRQRRYEQTVSGGRQVCKYLEHCRLERLSCSHMAHGCGCAPINVIYKTKWQPGLGPQADPCINAWNDKLYHKV